MNPKDLWICGIVNFSLEDDIDQTRVYEQIFVRDDEE